MPLLEIGSNENYKRYPNSSYSLSRSAWRLETESQDPDNDFSKPSVAHQFMLSFSPFKSFESRSSYVGWIR